ncbi:MAG TPA: discoidin domain-containing protein, partial [Terriglobales bacterium]
MKRLFLFVLAVASVLPAQQYTRGVGIYPGDPREFHGPSLVVDSANYRNLALHRPAYQSSAYDFNLTAQLVTDGIRDTRLPHWIISSTSQGGILPRFEREHLSDSNPVTSLEIPPTGGWIQLELAGGGPVPEVDRIEVAMRPQSDNLNPQPWTAVVLVSDDGQSWTEKGRATNTAVLGSLTWFKPYFVRMQVPLTSPVQSRFYRVQLDSPGVGKWEAGDLAFFDQDKRVQVSGPFSFTSAWKSAGSGEEWVYVDLGAECSFDRVVLNWIRRAAEGSIQVSDDAKNWSTLQSLPASTGNVDDLKLTQPAHGRYARVLMTRSASSDGYILSELEVYGRGGPLPKPKAQPAASANGRLELAGGAWRLQRDSQVTGDGAAISQPNFDDGAWLPATVPGTVLSSYVDDGALPDPNFGDNQLTISDSFFYADFWYRDEITLPRLPLGKRMWLNFDGVNWKADVFFNGERLGEINGGFTRGQFEITNLLRVGKNALSVRVHQNASPGAVKEKTLAKTDKNGGILGADNPTYHASIGWDWIPTIRGRNAGIWGGVYLTRSGPVTIEKPFASTTLPLP